MSNEHQDFVKMIVDIKGRSFESQRNHLSEFVQRGRMLGTDSVDYDQIVDGLFASLDVPGIVCEIGVRHGGSSQVILHSLAAFGAKGKTVLALDPYGHLPYVQSESATHRNDYTNSMRNAAMARLYELAQRAETNFVFMNLEDTEYFARFADGFPVYDMEKTLVNTYSFVHFDGPHSLATTTAEAEFFMARSSVGSVFVFDNVEDYYDHAPLAKKLAKAGWERTAYTKDKASYRRSK